MKKTVLSLALMLTISLGSEATDSNYDVKANFGREKPEGLSMSKPVSELKREIVQRVEKNKKAISVECYGLSCRTVCTLIIGDDLTIEQSIDNWYYFEERYCGN